MGGNGLPPSGTSPTICRIAPPPRTSSIESVNERVRAGQRGVVGRVAQERLAEALAEDAGLAARRAEDGPGPLAALAVAAYGVQPAVATVERQRPARRRLERDPRQPPHGLGDRRERD